MAFCSRDFKKEEALAYSGWGTVLLGNPEP